MDKITKAEFIDDILKSSKFGKTTGIYEKARKALEKLTPTEIHAVWCCTFLNSQLGFKP